MIAWNLIGLLACAGCNPSPLDPDGSAADLAAARARLVHSLQSQGITDPHVLAAMAAVPRHEFVRPQDRDLAYTDQALPIAGGQTISQPYIVALMTQLLELRGTERVLEIGTGSGMQAAVLAVLAREVYSIEIDPMLAAAAAERLRSLGYSNVHVRAGDGFYGWEEAAPFDAVIVTAAAPRVPERLVAQLAPGGRLVMPLAEDDHQTLIRGYKEGTTLRITPITGVLFVPMTGAVQTPTP
jgi:protein-L-isoaspartate(D-aspartate) O-methyltransferase